MKILVINAGSSSLKYQLFDMDDGTVLTYRFVPYDSNKMAVLLTHGSTNTVSNDFFVYATDVKALATQYLHLMGLSSQ